MQSYILLENIHFFAYHGLYQQENVVGNNFVINLKIMVDINLAMGTDKINDTISYADVYELVKKEMNIRSKLLEHVASRIIESLKHQFPQIRNIELKISKLNPPVVGQVEAASILVISDC